MPNMTVTFKEDSYTPAFPIESAFADTGCEGLVNGLANYFMSKAAATDYTFKLDFRCPLSFTKVKMTNSNNGVHQNR